MQEAGAKLCSNYGVCVGMREFEAKTGQENAADGATSAAPALASLGLIVWFALSYTPMLVGSAPAPIFGWNAPGAFETALPVLAAAVGYYAHKYPRNATLAPLWVITGHTFGMLAFVPPDILVQNYVAACALTLIGLLVVLMAAAGLARFIVFLSSQQVRHLDR